MTTRIHPESWREIEQLIKLHGARELIKIIAEVDAELAAEDKRNVIDLMQTLKTYNKVK